MAGDVKIDVGISTVIQAFHQEINRYRDAKKEEKEKIKESFLKVKKVLDSSLIKVGLTEMFDGFHDPIKLREYIPEIALELNKVARETADFFPTDIYNGLNAISHKFVEFNKYASIMGMCNLQNPKNITPIPNNSSFQNNLTLKQLVEYLKELRNTVELIEK
ncbi:MAG: hypothetical protein KKA58_03125 [Nanoarchaeota archaeon]|nr:hypothetical protein [Nanoarchaeota archaeon]MBU1876081.1 hypothetical protein [Nanoarchaeota archaeon]